MSEARTGKRFPLHLAATIHGGRASGNQIGTTANLSAAGVFIQAEANFEVGSKVAFDITLPGEMIGSRKDVLIRCQGRVVRTEGSKSRKGKSSRKKSGLACVIDSYKFVRK